MADRPWRNLAEGADNFRVAGMADEKNVPAFFDQPFGLAMDLGDQGAGGIDIGKTAVLRRRGHRFRYAMRGKDDRSVIGNFVELIDEDSPKLGQPVDDEAVVHDFMAHIDGCSEPLERELDDLDRSVDARAKAARRRNKHSKLGKFS